jgi:Ca2+-binding RTX toxin-like protein
LPLTGARTQVDRIIAERREVLQMMGRKTKRLVLLLTVVGATLVLSSTVALAAVRVGTNGNDRLVGTANDDRIYGKGGNDRTNGRAGNDTYTTRTGLGWIR